MSQVSLPQLLRSCQAGDARAIEELVSAYRPAVFRLALSVLDEAAEAEEATQDAFVAALRALPTYRGQSSFTTWLYAITLNVCRGRLRQRRARARLVGALQALFKGNARPAPEESVIHREAEAAVWHAIRALPEPQRLVVVLRYYHELRLGEIAEILDVTERTVHNRLHAAHERLRGLLKGKVEPP